jgi:putative peptidoglycan lipid II flippase
LFRQFPSKIGAGFLSGSTSFVNQFFAAQLLVGSLASFNYGLKIPSFLVSIMAVAIGNVILPYFSNMVFDDKKKAFQVLFKLIAYVFLASVIVVGSFFLFSETIIGFLFEKGNFTSKDTAVVSQIQRILLLFVPFYISGVILNKFLTSINRNVFMLYTSILNLILNLVLNYSLAKLYGIYGLAIATTSVSIINFVVLYIIVYYQKKQINEIS